MIHIGVIGCGYWGPNLVRNFNDIDGSTVVAVCDLDVDRLREIQRKYPATQITMDFHDLLDDPTIDAVCIATPVSTHYLLGKEALLHNKHVLMEKPLAASTAEAQSLVDLAAKQQRILMVGHTFQYHPAVIKIKEMLDRGEVGDLYYVDSCRVNLGLHQFDVNVVWDLAPHDLSMILYWLGTEPVRVTAQGAAYAQNNVEDVAFITLEFPNKVLAHIHISWLAPSKLRRTTIVGSKKMIVYDDLENVEKVKVYDRGVVSLQNEGAVRELQRTYRIGDIVSPRVETVEALRNECEHFLGCIRERRRPRSSGQDGLRVVKIIEAIESSLRHNGRVEVI
jgi:predicted dehydrogenase